MTEAPRPCGRALRRFLWVPNPSGRQTFPIVCRPHGLGAEAAMSRMQFECPGCGEPVPSLFGGIFHCDPVEPIDDITDTP